VDIYEGPKSREVFERIANVVTSQRFLAGLVAGVILIGRIYLFAKSSKGKAA
jgi:hypothetical protein